MTTDTACREWQGSRTTAGYGRVKQRGTTYYIHRLIYALKTGECPPVVMHSCDNPPCFNPDHLVGGDHAKNRQDCVAKKRHAYRERNGRAKLTSGEIATIRALVTSGVSQLQIGQQFGVCKSQIGNIARGEQWR
jgi:hypothetical protein